MKNREGLGFVVTYLPVDEYGMVSVENIAEAITPETILVTIMHANNEVNRLPKWPDAPRERGTVTQTDAAPSVGQIASDVEEPGVELLPLAGQKLYAPKGIGVLNIRTGTQFAKLMQGAGHEQGRWEGGETFWRSSDLGSSARLSGENWKRTYYT